MSRLWAERLRIGLAPDRVELACFGVGGAGKPSRQTSLPCERKPHQKPWEAALDALDAPLAEWGLRGGSVAAVLSNHWVRYLVIPWQPAVTGAAEIGELARVRFEHTFGEAAGAWSIRCSDSGYGEPTIACAVDTALVDGLRTKLAAHKLRLTSVQPLLMAAYNDLRRELADDAAFAIVEPGRLCLSLYHGGQWSEIVSRRAGANPADAVEQELAAAAHESAPVRIDVLLVGEAPGWPEHSARPARLLGPSAAGGGCSLALCGRG